jgi:CheY-like chemotaxis protein
MSFSERHHDRAHERAADHASRHRETHAHLPLVARTPNRLRVLCVEDDPVQALLLTLMLDRLDVESTLVTDGAQAVAAVQVGRFDLVLMDYRMPVCNGVDATRSIRQWEREVGRVHTPVIAVTASGMAEERAACRDAGMDDVILKPFSARALAEALVRHGATKSQAAFLHGAVS